MQATRAIEIWVGVFVTLALLALFFVAMEVSNLGEFRSAHGSYLVQAHFGNIGGLKVRAPISMAGVTVGRVERISFDDKNYEAVVDMRIDPTFQTLPDDTSASILTAGLLGEQYIGLTAGGSEDYLKDGDKIELTQSAMILEQLISKFLFNKAEDNKGDKKSSDTVAKDNGQDAVSPSTSEPVESKAQNEQQNLSATRPTVHTAKPVRSSKVQKAVNSSHPAPTSSKTKSHAKH